MRVHRRQLRHRRPHRRRPLIQPLHLRQLLPLHRHRRPRRAARPPRRRPHLGGRRRSRAPLPLRHLHQLDNLRQRRRHQPRRPRFLPGIPLPLPAQIQRHRRRPFRRLPLGQRPAVLHTPRGLPFRLPPQAHLARRGSRPPRIHLAADPRRPLRHPPLRHHPHPRRLPAPRLTPTPLCDTSSRPAKPPATSTQAL